MRFRDAFGTGPLVLAATALFLGAALGYGGARLGEADPKAPPEVIAEGVLSSLPRGKVQVRAESVFLPAGFRSRHLHGGPTFNFVDSGALVIESSGRRVEYGEGDFFFEPARRAHVVTVLGDARLRVVRLLPPGAEATIEVP